jgi:hypothetical protein
LTPFDTDLVAHIVRGNAEYLASLIIEQPGSYTPERIAIGIAKLATRISTP